MKSITKNEPSSHEKTWRKFKCMLLRERNQYEKCRVSHSNYMTFWKRQSWGAIKDQWLPGVNWRKGWIGRTQHFQGSETALCITTVETTCHYTLVKIHSMFNTKGEHYWPPQTLLVIGQKWGFGCPPPQRSSSRGRGWWERKEAFIRMLNDLGEWRTLHLRLIAFHKTQTKLSGPQQDPNERQCPEFLLHVEVLSSGAQGSG